MGSTRMEYTIFTDFRRLGSDRGFAVRLNRYFYRAAALSELTSEGGWLI